MLNLLKFPEEGHPGIARAARLGDDPHFSVSAVDAAEATDAYAATEVDTESEEEPLIPPGAVTFEDGEDGLETFLGETGGVYTRTLSRKKAKKVTKLTETMVKEQGQLHAAMRATPRAPPPRGRCYLKQLFAGQMGLTLLASALSYDCAVPLDIHVGWDAASRAGVRRLDLDLQDEDPYATVITHPCGPWGAWSRFNLSRGGSARQILFEPHGPS